MSGWLSGDPCTLCGRPVDVVVSDSIGDHEMAVVRPCGHRLMGDDLVAFRKPEPAPDKAVLRRCAAERKIVEAVQRYLTGHPGRCVNVLDDDPDKVEYDEYDSCALHIEWSKTTLPPLALEILAEAYGLEVTE